MTTPEIPRQVAQTQAPYSRDFKLELLEPTYLVRLSWIEINGRMECVGFEVLGSEPITTSLLRRIPAARIIDEQRRQKTYDLRRSRELENTSWGEHYAERVAEAKRLHPLFEEGKQRYSPEHWQQVADVYRDAYMTGENPTRAVAEAFTVSRSAAAKWVARCRDKDLLGKTEQRKAGGITPEGDDA